MTDNACTSVVIPAYNAEKYLPAALDSVLAQTRRDWEAIVVDDGSSDATNDIANSYAQADARIRVVRQENRGLPAARNRGMDASNPQTTFLAFLDSDDVLEPDALQTLTSALEANPAAVASHGVVRFIDEQGHLWRPGEAEKRARRRRGVAGKRLAEFPRSAPTTFSMLVFRNCIDTPGAALVRRAELEKCGRFDETLRSCEDWEMWLRMTERGDFAFADRIVLNYRRHGSNMSSKDKTMRQAELQMRHSILTTHPLNPQQRQIALQGYRLCERNYLSLELRLVRKCLRQRLFRNAAGHLRRAAYAGARSLPCGPL